jgi:hypothetical protein
MATPETRNWTRNRADDCHISDDTRITTGPGRYTLEAPNGYCNASFAPEPTTRQQKWGSAQVDTYGKTDVESDLFNINRTTSKSVCGLYDPNDNRMNSATKKNIKESSFPQTFARLNDPPCTLRGTGWNRWQWLCNNPQDNVMMPFDWYVPGRILHKDAHRPCIPTPLSPNPVLPKPLHISQNTVDVPGVNGVSMTDGGSFGQTESPAYVLPQSAYKSASVLDFSNSSSDMLLDSRNIAWEDAPSIAAVPFPVPTGPPSVGWQRNDFARGLYNTNTTATSRKFGQELSGPSLNTTA